MNLRKPVITAVAIAMAAMHTVFAMPAFPVSPALATPGHARSPHVLAMGCYARTYPAQHMNRSPGQSVRKITVQIGPDTYGTNGITFGMDARLRGKPQAWRAGGACKGEGATSAASWHCQPDTDGAPVIILKASGGNMLLENPGHLQLFDDRTGPDLNTHTIGGASERQFVLMPVDAKLCKGG